LLGLYWWLLFSGREYSLGQLADILNCSKPSVLRLITQLEASGFANVESWIENRQRWYRLKAPQQRPRVSLDVEDLEKLMLCRDMVWHLIPDSIRASLDRSIGHATALLPSPNDRALITETPTTVHGKGTVDYSQKETIVEGLFTALRENRVCRVNYKSPQASEARIHHVAPQRLIISGNSLYLRGWLLVGDGDAGEPNETNMAIQRIEELQLTDQTYSPPKSNRDDSRGKNFGLIEGDPFRVRVSFDRSAARYVSERVWSDDQVLEQQPDGGVILEFTTTSKPEVIALVLSFGATATVLSPNNLVTEMREVLQKTAENYKA